MSFPSSSLPSPPDPTSRQPFTNAAILPLNFLYYVIAVLTILPHTFFLKLVFLPIILWQAWKCAVRLDYSLGLENSMGLEVSAGLSNSNNLFVVRFCHRSSSSFLLTLETVQSGMIDIALSPSLGRSLRDHLGGTVRPWMANTALQLSAPYPSRMFFSMPSISYIISAESGGRGRTNYSQK